MNRYFAVFVLLLFPAFAYALPEPMLPPRLVNDFAHVFSQEEARTLEEMLLRYHDETSTQIFVVTVASLEEKESLAYATELGNKWGAGQAGKDNGVMILIKPKRPGGSGDVAIALGDGIVGLINQGDAQKIINNILIPMFKRELYAEGVQQAATMIDMLLKNAFSPAPGATPSHSTRSAPAQQAARAASQSSGDSIVFMVVSALFAALGSV